MHTIILRPARPDHDFKQLAAWFSVLEDEPSSEASLKAYYDQQRARITQRVAENESGELVGFYWAIHHKLDAGQILFFLYVTPEQRGHGLGSRLYADLERVSEAAQAKKLQVNVWDTCLEGRHFAEQRGFAASRHQFAMELDLTTFDNRPYDELITKLTDEGFQFTSMEALGNTEEAQRKLYALNDMTSREIPGTDGSPSWASFDDFQQSVCQAEWYMPGGQIVVIESRSGEWVGLSAITHMPGNTYAYNLHTGVDRRYRGRKLAQAAKGLALRYARDVLKTPQVRTHHNSKNLPIIAINRKLGYRQLPGQVLMEKLF